MRDRLRELQETCSQVEVWEKTDCERGRSEQLTRRNACAVGIMTAYRKKS